MEFFNVLNIILPTGYDLLINTMFYMLAIAVMAEVVIFAHIIERIVAEINAKFIISA